MTSKRSWLLAIALALVVGGLLLWKGSGSQGRTADAATASAARTPEPGATGRTPEGPKPGVTGLRLPTFDLTSIPAEHKPDWVRAKLLGLDEWLKAQHPTGDV